MAIEYGIQVRLRGEHPWIWLCPNLTTTKQPALAAAWESEHDAKDAMNFIASSRGNGYEFRAQSKQVTPRV